MAQLNPEPTIRSLPQSHRMMCRNAGEGRIPERRDARLVGERARGRRTQLMSVPSNT